MASLALKNPSNTRFAENRQHLSVPGVAPDRISRKAVAVLVVLLVTFVLLQSLIPLRTAIRIGADEDFELAKATLSLKGYHFYTEVWNEQPLLHTFLVTQVLKHLSPSILRPRLVTSAFAVLLLTSVFFIGLRVSGLWVAALTSAMLIASPGFLELSSSCMVEVPALAPAVAGLSTLLMGRQGKWQGIISGVLFAIAFQVKFINVILLPLAALIVWLKHWKTKLPLPRPSVTISLHFMRGEVGGRVLPFSVLFR